MTSKDTSKNVSATSETEVAKDPSLPASKLNSTDAKKVEDTHQSDSESTARTEAANAGTHTVAGADSTDVAVRNANIEQVSAQANDLQKQADSASSQEQALKQQPVKPVAGSPVTSGTAADTGAGGVDATIGNFSPNTVAGTNTSNSPDTPDTNDQLTMFDAEHGETLSDEEADALERALTPSDEYSKSYEKLEKLVATTETSPDSHTVWGAGGVTITLGDLRNILRG